MILGILTRTVFLLLLPLLLLLVRDVEIELQISSNCILHTLNENMLSSGKTIQSAQNYAMHNAKSQLALDSLEYSALQFYERFSVITRS